MKSMTIRHTFGQAAPSLWHSGTWLRTVSRLPVAWVTRARNRRELDWLLGQPDYMLKDIGVPRDEIVREAIKPFWRA